MANNRIQILCLSSTLCKPCPSSWFIVLKR